VPASTALSAGKNEPQPYQPETEEHLETGAELGYGLDKNQVTFGW
jgi:hypothetical protein